MDLTYNDYYTTSGNADTWEVHLKPCTEQVDSYYRECIRAAKLIENESSKEIILMFSGGIDGEFMLNIFKDANIHFKVAIISYGKWNKHDSKYAFDYCNKHKINPKIIEVDIEDMVKSELIYEIAENGKASAHQMIGVMHGITQLNGCIVMANCEPQVNLENGKWVWDEPERTNAYRHWYKYADIEGTPDFPRYTAEQSYSYLTDPLVKQLVNGELDYTGTKPIKHTLYNRYFYQKERFKYTGWEYLERQPIFNEIYSKFTSLRERYNGQFVLEYKDVLDKLRPNI